MCAKKFSVNRQQSNSCNSHVHSPCNVLYCNLTVLTDYSIAGSQGYYKDDLHSQFLL